MGDHKLSIIQTRASILGISQDGSTDNEQENEKLGGKASAGILLSPGGADSTTLIISFFKFVDRDNILIIFAFCN